MRDEVPSERDETPPRLGHRARRPRPWPALVSGALLLIVLGAVVGSMATRSLRAAATASSPTPMRSAGGPLAGNATAAQIAGVAEVLGAMTRAVRARDEAAYLAVVDARDRSLRQRQRGVFRGLVALPLTDPRFGWGTGDCRTPQHPAAYPPGAVDVPVELQYRLSGWDDAGATDVLSLTLAPVQGHWLLVGDTEDLPGMPAGRFAEPWTASALVVAARPHVLVVSDPGHRAAAQRLAARLETAVADVRRRWPEPSWNGRVVAYAVTDRRFVREWFGDQAADGRQDDPHGEASFEARVATLGGEEGGPVQGGPARLIVTPYLLGRADDYSLSVLRHEVTHVATARVGRYPPMWLLEGAAEYTGFRVGGAHVDAAATVARHGLPTATLRALQRGTWRPRLVADPAAFYSGASASVENDYVDGWLAALYVADTYGDATLRRLYDAACGCPDTASWVDVEAAALRSALGVDRAAFTASVRDYAIELRHDLR